jgi:hypothetical protein
MLRISYSDAGAGQRWHLCGQLAGPWVGELRSCWQHARQLASRSQAVVDLSDVTFIDEAGERLLSEMRGAGVEFVAAGVETKHLLEGLKGKGARPLRRSIGHLTGASEEAEFAKCNKGEISEK